MMVKCTENRGHRHVTSQGQGTKSLKAELKNLKDEGLVASEEG